MKELSLPHIAPIRFAKDIFSLEETEAKVALLFDEIPSLGMMIEAAAQASAAFGGADTKGGVLVSLKNIKLLLKPQKKALEVVLIKEHDLGNMSYFSFMVFEESVELVNGSFVIAKS